MKRRKFLGSSIAATTGAVILPTLIPASVMGKNPPSDRIQIGQIGCGRIARGHDIGETIRYDKARFVAVCDVDSKRLSDGKKLIEEHYAARSGTRKYSGVKMYGDYREMLSDRSLDAVIISTPDHWHARPAIEAALAGKDIYLQKPTSLTIAEGRLLSDIVRRQGVILQVGTQQRSSSQFRVAAELVRNGRIGKLHTVKIGLPGDPSGPNAPEMPVPKNLNFDMWLGSTPLVPYTEMGVHPQNDYGRPGWLRLENYGAGMITGWDSITSTRQPGAWIPNTLVPLPFRRWRNSPNRASGMCTVTLWSRPITPTASPCTPAGDSPTASVMRGVKGGSLSPAAITWLRQATPCHAMPAAKLWMPVTPGSWNRRSAKTKSTSPGATTSMATGLIASSAEKNPYRQWK